MYDYLLKKLLRSITNSGTSISENARDYIATLQGPIRLFGTDGPGFGDQMFIINIAHCLYHLGYRGILEVIGNTDSLRRYQQYDEHTPAFLDRSLGLLPLPKFLFLIGQNFSENIVSIPGMGNLRVLPLDTFLQDKGPRTELAIMGGSLGFIKAGYNVLGTQREDIVTFANTQKVICLSPFTGVPTPFSRQTNIGFIFIDAHKIESPYYLAKTLPYSTPPLEKDTLATLTATALQQVLKTHPGKGALLKTITQENTGAHTFVVYGLNPMRYPSPHYPLFNLIIAASKRNIHSGKPLLVLIMNDISDEAWGQLKLYFQLPVINKRSPPTHSFTR